MRELSRKQHFSCGKLNQLHNRFESLFKKGMQIGESAAAGNSKLFQQRSNFAFSGHVLLQNLREFTNISRVPFSVEQFHQFLLEEIMLAKRHKYVFACVYWLREYVDVDKRCPKAVKHLQSYLKEVEDETENITQAGGMEQAPLVGAKEQRKKKEKTKRAVWSKAR